jgi:hypothetical protein
MKIRRLLSLAIASAVVAISSIGTAGAGTGTAVLYGVHGIPGVRVDVCIAGLGEVQSRLPYATRFRQELEPGSASLKIRRASKGQCRGDILARRALDLNDGDNVTAVVRIVAGDPAIDTFNNNVAPTAPGNIRFTAIHAMSGPAVDVWANGAVEISDLDRGDQASTTLDADTVYSIWGSKAGESSPIVGPRVIENTGEGQAFSFVMVGTKVANNRVVVFKQSVNTT